MSPDWWRDCRDGIEKCSSPTGDGNCGSGLALHQEQNIEKCSSPTGDGNKIPEILYLQGFPIEKCSSPTGDGNTVLNSNVVIMSY